MTLKMIVLATLGALAATELRPKQWVLSFAPPDLSGVYRCVHSCSGAGLGRIVAHRLGAIPDK